MRFFLALLFLIAVTASALRFCNIDNRLLWGDESVSVMRAAGYTEADLSRALYDGRQHTVRQMRYYQGWGPSRPSLTVVQSLMLEDPHHPPLYFLLLHFWQLGVGASLASQRVLSVATGIALIPAMYWLCLELFGSRRTATIGAALISVSPFFFAYSRELREYGLFALSALVSHALLLRAQRSPGPLIWILYALSLTIGLYSDIFFVILIFAHAVYLFISNQNSAVKWWGFGALLCAAALYSPWILVFLLRVRMVESMTDWSAGAWPLKMLSEKWLFNAGTTFFDLEYDRLWLGIFLVPILCSLLYALLFVARKATDLQRKFIGSLLLATSSFYVSDLVLHAHRSAVTRYGTLSYLTLLLCMAGMLGYETGIRRRRIFWQGVTVAMVTAALCCCIASSQRYVWWDNFPDDEIIPIAERINAAEHPLIVAPTRWQRIFLLSFRLNENVRIVFPSNRSAELAPSENAFLVTEMDDLMSYESHFRGTLFKPLYVGHLDSTWEVFHRPMGRGHFLEADGTKLSLWKIMQHSSTSVKPINFSVENAFCGFGCFSRRAFGIESMNQPKRNYYIEAH